MKVSIAPQKPANRPLKIVNSPFYGLSTKVETITHAITIAGVEQLSELALVTALLEKFDGFFVELQLALYFGIRNLQGPSPRDRSLR